MQGIIDADTHVVESEEMWEHFPKALAARKPIAVPAVDEATGRGRNYWLIDGNLVPHPEGKGGQNLQTPPLDPKEKAERTWTTKALLDVESRLQDADTMGVDVQVVFPTLFIAHLTWDAELDVALAQAYNRFLAEAWKRGGRRLRWVAVMPFHDIETCVKELRWANDHGAVGFNARGVEGDRSLAEPYFFPLYEEADRLDMPMCIHTGPGCPALTSVIDNRIGGSFPGVRMLPLMAAQNLITNRIPERFHNFRIGFIETGASWVPYVLHYVERDWRRRKAIDVPHLGPELFQDYRIFCAIESDEDIPYLMDIIGQDNLITGSDYGHHGGQLPTLDPDSFTNRTRGGDPSADLSVMGTLQAREDLPGEALQKILVDNPKRFYGL